MKSTDKLYFVFFLVKTYLLMKGGHGLNKWQEQLEESEGKSYRAATA